MLVKMENTQAAAMAYPGDQERLAAPNSSSTGLYDPIVLNNLVNTWALKAFFLCPGTESREGLIWFRT